MYYANVTLVLKRTRNLMSIDGINRTQRNPTRRLASSTPTRARYAARNHVASVNQKIEPPKLTGSDVIKPRRAASTHKPAMPRQKRSAVLIRRTFAPKFKKKQKLTDRINFKVFALFAVVVMNASVLGYVLLDTQDTNVQEVATAPSVLGAREDGASGGVVPSEAAVSMQAIAEYDVAPDLPKEIEIPKLDVLARIVRMPVRSDNKLELPDNIFDAGWHDVSAKPGEIGAVLLHGHVSGVNEPGVFARIGSLQVDDEIIVRRGDNQIFKYTVSSIERVDRDSLDISNAVTVDNEEANGLTLVSYSNRFDVRTNKYEQRLVVRATQQ